jgi:hypothetical protein
MHALHVADVTFDPPPTVPQTDLEIMLFGDRWKLAVEGADRRLRWPATRSVDEEDGPDADDTAWFEASG